MKVLSHIISLIHEYRLVTGQNGIIPGHGYLAAGQSHTVGVVCTEYRTVVPHAAVLLRAHVSATHRLVPVTGVGLLRTVHVQSLRVGVHIPDVQDLTK